MFESVKKIFAGLMYNPVYGLGSRGDSMAEKRSISISDTPNMLRLLNITSSGVTVNTETIVGINHLFRGIAIRAGLIATMPRHVYRSRENENTVERAHPVDILLSVMPNDEYTPFEFWWQIEWTAMLYGGGGALIIRDPGTNRPTGLKLFRCGCTMYKVAKNDPIQYFDNEDGALYAAEDVFFVGGVSVGNGLRQMTLAQAFKDTFGEHLATQMLVSSFMENAPHLSAVYTYTGPKRDKPDSYGEEIRRYFSGLDKAGGVLPIANGDNFQQLKPTGMQEAAAVDLKRLSVGDSARITGVPVSLLMELDKPSYNSLTQLFLQFKITTLDPRVTQIDQQLTSKLLRPTEQGRYFVETDIDEMMWASPEERVKYWEALFKMAAIKPNEIRAYMNRSPVDGGDEVFVQINNLMPMSQVLKGLNTASNAIEQQK